MIKRDGYIFIENPTLGFDHQFIVIKGIEIWALHKKSIDKFCTNNNCGTRGSLFKGAWSVEEIKAMLPYLPTIYSLVHYYE